jgi:hypothetical protein
VDVPKCGRTPTSVRRAWMMDADKPPVLREQPPIQRDGPKPNYPEVFVNARWRLGIIGGVGALGIFAATAILSVPSSPGDKTGIVLFAVLASFFSILVIYALLHLRAKWVLHEDRLEYRSYLGIQKTIRRLDVLSFGPDWTGVRSVLRDARQAIPVGWEVARFSYLCDILRSWAPRGW